MTAPGGDPDHQAAPWVPPTPQPPSYPAPPYTSYPPTGYPPPYPGDYAADYPPPGYEQPPYGAPSYGPPPYPPAQHGPGPYPGYPGGFPGAAQQGMNGLAIASLISSFAGVFCCLGSVAAIVMGTIALDQIKRDRQDGYGLAVAGIVIGIATLVVVFIVSMFAMRSH